MFVLSILVLVYILFKPDFDVLTVAPYILFIQNFSSPHPSFFPEAWSLSVEEWFYCLLPIFVVFWTYFCKFAPKKSFVYTIVLCIIIVMAFRYYRFVEITLVSVNDWDLFFRKQVITRLDSLMYGVLGGWIAFYYPQKWSKYKKLVFFVGLFFLLFDRYFAPILFGEIGLYSAVFSFSIISFSVLLLLPFLSTWKTYYGFMYKPIMYISLCSY